MTSAAEGRGATVVLPVDLGVLGLYDVGRVGLDGESSNRWHDAVGGGVWFAFLGRENVVTVTLATGDDGTGTY